MRSRSGLPWALAAAALSNGLTPGVPQDETLRRQEELQDQVSDVHSSVQAVSQVLVNMEQKFLDNQAYANEGIYMLCRRGFGTLASAQA